MAEVRLHHHTEYVFDSAVHLFPHTIRLHPIPFLFLPQVGRISDYHLDVSNDAHIRWQTDAYGNTVARATFDEPTDRLDIDVHLTANLIDMNPFDFLLEPAAFTYPADYGMAGEFTTPIGSSEILQTFIDEHLGDIRGRDSVSLLVDLNSAVASQIAYNLRLETGVQDPDETLTLGSGSCRDSAWLEIALLRHLGIGARFVSGYLIQTRDGTLGADLHAWAEAFLPGAGWIGLDSTSGLIASSGHLATATGPDPTRAAPISGTTGLTSATLGFQLDVTTL